MLVNVCHLLAACLIAAGLHVDSVLAQGNRMVAVIGPDLVVSATINAQPVRLKFVTDGSEAILLNPDTAARIGLPEEAGTGVVRIGPVTLTGHAAKVDAVLLDMATQVRVAWFDHPVSQGFDGEIGPAALPHSIVKLQFAAAAPDAQATMLPLISRNGQGLGSQVKVGGQSIFLNWSVERRGTRATAAAAAVLAKANGGQFVGQGWREVIAFKVERPLRRMALDRPLPIASFSLQAMTVRTTDYGNTRSIPDAEADPGEIVVTARGKPVKPVRKLTMGLDAIQGCSSLAFDKILRTITFECTKRL